MKKMVKLFFSSLLVLFLIFATYIMITGFISFKKNEPLFVLNYGYATVKTESMQIAGNKDSLHVGDIIFYKRIKYEQLKVNDIIIFKQYSEVFNQDILIVHRIISINDDGTITTKGDNNNSSDEPIKESEFRAIVTSKLSIPKYGLFITNNRGYLFLFIFVIGLVGIALEITSLVKSINKKNREKIILHNQMELENYQEEIKQSLKK